MLSLTTLISLTMTMKDLDIITPWRSWSILLRSTRFIRGQIVRLQLPASSKLDRYIVSNYAFVYPRTSDFELGAKFESGVETEILVRVGLELPLDQNSFCETP